MYQMMSQLMSQMWDLIGFDDEKPFSYWGFSRRGMHNAVVDAISNQTKDGAPRRGRPKQQMKTQASGARTVCASLFVGIAAAHFFNRMAALSLRSYKYQGCQLILISMAELL